MYFAYVFPMIFRPKYLFQLIIYHSISVSVLVSVLKAMSMEPVIHADIAPRGTQLKLLLTLKGGQKVLFKPKW